MFGGKTVGISVNRVMFGLEWLRSVTAITAVFRNPTISLYLTRPGHSKPYKLKCVSTEHGEFTPSGRRAFTFSMMDSGTVIIEPRCEKTGLRGFRPVPTQTGLCATTEDG